MLIPSDEICYDVVIGRWGNKTLHGCGTVGGLHLVLARSPDGTKEIIGAGSHRGVARHVAKKMHSDVEFTMLEKSNDIDIRDIQDILPFWEQVTVLANQKIQ